MKYVQDLQGCIDLARVHVERVPARLQEPASVHVEKSLRMI